MFLDNWSSKRIYTAEIVRRISGCVPCNGINGRESVPGDPNGFGSRKNELPTLSDALRHQTSSFGWDNSQGTYQLVQSNK